MKKATNSVMPSKIIDSILNRPLGKDGGEDAEPLVVCAANSSRFKTANFNAGLTAYTIGWKDPENLEELLEFIAPECLVPNRFSIKRADNNEIFLSEVDDIRAIGAQFKRIEYTGDELDLRTHNKGLTIRVDHDEEVVPGWERRYTGLLMQRLIRNDLRRAVALLLAAGNNTAVTWNAAALPDSDLRKMLRRTKAANGLRGNRVIMGGASWEARLDSYESTPDNNARFSRADRTPEQLASYLMVKGVKVSEAIYQSGATAKSDIIGSVVAGYYAESGLMKDDPSNIKRFVSPTPQGKFRVYQSEKDKFTDITVEHYSNNVITVAGGIEKLTVTGI